MLRGPLPVIAAAVVLAAACALFLTFRPHDDLNARRPVIVAGLGLSGFGPGPAADRATEAAWLDGEALALGLRTRGVRIEVLRRRVADALADRAGGHGSAAFVAAFEAYHARWRATTRCLAEYADPYADRCSNLATPEAGPCRWMAEAWLCGGAPPWTVVGQGRGTAARLRREAPASAGRIKVDRRSGTFTVRVRSRATAARLVYAIYRPARQARDAAARRARAEREREERAREWRARLAAPRLTDATLTALKPVCRRYALDVDAYRFGLGLQDPAGSADGILAARTRGERGAARAVRDTVDRRKLGRLLTRMRATDRALTRVQVAGVYGDVGALRSGLARHRSLAGRETGAAQTLGVGECLATPTA
jgi:hypothetical protein